MIKSALLYTRYFGSILFHQNRAIVASDYKRSGKSVFNQIPVSDRRKRHQALDCAIRWLNFAQQQTPDNGIGYYHLVNGWTGSYPETTGYIIPSLLSFGEKYKGKDTIETAIKAADWLVEIQKESGGWQGGRVEHNRPEIVFNTAQIIRGMLAVNAYTSHQKYFDAAIKASHWLADVQLFPESRKSLKPQQWN